MRHLRKGRQLSRDSEHRIALFRNMAQSLIEHGKIKTTLPKALEVQPVVEKLITKAKKGDLHNRRLVIASMRDRRITDAEQEFTGQTVVQKLFSDIAPRYADRNGGYTRIIKLPDHRIGDGGDWVLLQLVGDESEAAPTGSFRKAAGLRKKRNERRFQFAKNALKTAPATSGAAAEPAGAAE